MTHKVVRIDAETVEYRGRVITRSDRNRGYWNHYTTKATGGFSGATLTEVKFKIDRSHGDQPAWPTSLTIGASSFPHAS